MDMPELPAIETEDAHETGRKSVRRPRVELLMCSERRRWSIDRKEEIVAERGVSRSWWDAAGIDKTD
jgi:hypothetical protein